MIHKVDIFNHIAIAYFTPGRVVIQ